MGKTLTILVCVHWCVSDAFPLTFLLKLSTNVCSLLFHRCLLLTSCNWPRLQQTCNTLKTEVEIEVETTAKSKLKSKLRSKPQTEIEIEIEADWKLKSKSKPRSTTEIEIEIEIDHWKRDQNGNRLRSQKDFWKSTSSPVSRTSGFVSQLFFLDFKRTPLIVLLQVRRMKVKATMRQISLGNKIWGKGKKLQYGWVSECWLWYDIGWALKVIANETQVPRTSPDT